MTALQSGSTEADDEAAALGRSYFPRRLLTDFFDFLSAHSHLEVLTYADFQWRSDWDYKNGYPEEHRNWEAQLKSGERDSNKAYIVLQYDVDTRVDRSMELLRAPEHRDIPAAVMIFNRRIDRPQLRKGTVFETEYELDRGLLRKLQASGFVIGYHSNAFERGLFDEKRALEIFDRDLEELSQDFRIGFFSAHGGVPSPDGRNNNTLTFHPKWRRRIRWVHNGASPYFDAQFSDGGHNSPLRDPRSRDLRDFVAKFKPGGRYRILLHPQYYDVESFGSDRFAGTPWYDELLASHRANPRASLWRDVRLDWARPQTKLAQIGYKVSRKLHSWRRRAGRWAAQP